MKQETLFDTTPYIDQEYVKLIEQKKKWTKGFKAYIETQYLAFGENFGANVCGQQSYCEFCEMKKSYFCDDCIDTMIKIFKNNNIKYWELEFDKAQDLAERLVDEKI